MSLVEVTWGMLSWLFLRPWFSWLSVFWNTRWLFRHWNLRAKLLPHGRCLSPTVARAGSGWRGRSAHDRQRTTIQYDTTTEIEKSCCSVSVELFKIFQVMTLFQKSPPVRIQDSIQWATRTETLVLWILSCLRMIDLTALSRALLLR